MDLILSLYDLRWHNHLNPDIRKDAWTTEEEQALINAHRVYGNKWAEIAKVLPGRYC
jgi:myb proto-oncogene protein